MIHRAYYKEYLITLNIVIQKNISLNKGKIKLEIIGHHNTTIANTAAT